MQISNQLMGALEYYLNEILNNALRSGQLNSSQSINIKNIAMQNLPTLGQNLAQAYGGKIPSDEVKKAVFNLINQIINNINSSMGYNQYNQNGMMGGYGGMMMGGNQFGGTIMGGNQFGSNPINLGNQMGMNPNQQVMSNSNPISISPKKENTTEPENESEEKSINDVFIRDGVSKSPQISILNSGIPDKVEGFNIDSINVGKAIKEFKNSENGIVYTYLKSEYSIPEENDYTMINNALKIFKKIFDNKRKIIFDIEYPEMFLMENAKYDIIKENYNNVKTELLSKGFNDAIQALNNQSFIFSNIFKTILIGEINLMLKLFIRDHDNINTIFKITDLEDINELLTLHRTSGYRFLEIDDFDGYMFNLINQIFNKYFGRKSRILTIEEDIKHILTHKDVIIRNAKFTDRDFDKINDDEFIETIKNYTILAFNKRLVFTNILPNAFINIFEENNHDTYVFDTPSNALESIIASEICSSISSPVKLVITEDDVYRNYMIGKIINGNTIILKR